MSGIDVLVPSYQYGQFLRDAVTSILKQGIDNLRVLIIDNASTDNSAEVARKLAAEDCRVEVRVHPSNLGHTASINEGIDWAAQEYFLMFCADDVMAPGSLARAVSLMDQHPNVAFAIGAEVEWSTGDIFPEIDQGLTCAQWRISPGLQFIAERCSRPASFVALGTMVVRTSAQKKAGYYRAELKYTMDVEMMLRLACLGDVGETSAVQGIRRLHGSNLTDYYVKSPSADFAYRQASFENFFEQEGSVIPEAGRLRRRVKRNLAGRAYWLGIRQLCRGDGHGGLDFLKYACRVNPANAVFPPIDYLLHRAVER